jgi:hypothetical protein
MTILREIAGELIEMFIGEKPLAIALLIIVATAGFLTNFTGLGRLVGGMFLLLGCLILLVKASVAPPEQAWRGRLRRLPHLHLWPGELARTPDRISPEFTRSYRDPLAPAASS